jgi:hypothetical protein
LKIASVVPEKHWVQMNTHKIIKWYYNLKIRECVHDKIISLILKTLHTSKPFYFTTCSPFNHLAPLIFPPPSNFFVHPAVLVSIPIYCPSTLE